MAKKEAAASTRDAIITSAREAIEVDAYVSEGGLKVHYPHPKEVFGPFVDRLADLPVERVTVNTMRPVKTREEGGREHLAYGRMQVEALIGDEDIYGHRVVVGKVYVFDHKNAHYVIYGGRRAMVCLNLHLMKADQLFTISATDAQFGSNETNILLDRIEADNAEWIQHVNQFQGTELDRAGAERLLGGLLVRSVGPATHSTGFGSEIVAGAAKLLSTGTSRYAISQDGRTNAWNVLQSVTQQITDRVYMNQAPQKTLTVVNAFKEELGFSLN